MRRLVRLLATVRYLRPVQVYNRVSRRLLRPRLDVRPPPPCRAAAVDEFRFLPRARTRLSSTRFRLLNQTRDVPADGWGEPPGDLLWQYEFHYFDGLLASSLSAHDGSEWILDWIRRVTPGSEPAWAPYPMSRRILNWIKWRAMVGDDQVPEGFHDSLAVQVRHLAQSLEFHLLGNHLLANAAALVAAGLHFGGPEGARWLSVGGELLDDQLDEQFLPDGGHFELSPSYHALILEDLLDLRQLAAGIHADGVRGPSEEVLRLALEWLEFMVRPDGRLPLFNDAVHDPTRTPAVLSEYARALGIAGASEPATGLAVSSPSGYFRYRVGRLFVCGDVGEVGPRYQPGHAHCDLSSFELVWDGVPVMVDAGTSTYESGARRTWERGTSAHNVVQVGEDEQSEIWASFRMGRRARVLTVDQGERHVAVQFAAFPGRAARLERIWQFAGESACITDKVLSMRRPGPCTARFHLHPDVRVTGSGSQWRVNGLDIAFEGNPEVRLTEYEFAPQFNVRRCAPVLEVRFADTLVTRVMS